MRKLLMVAMVAGLCLGVSHDADANFFVPGVVTIGGPNGPPKGGTTKSAPAAAMEGCDFDKIECECFPNTSLVDACKISGQPIDCFTPELAYDFVDQPEKQPVLFESEAHRFVELKCVGKFNTSAYVQLSSPPPEGQPPSP